MNSYKITYVSGPSERAEAYVTERSEAAARKALQKSIGNHEIIDVELHETDVCATKAQERATLAKIKAMVEELGPRSYLATAFEGCFEIAEQNIDDDAAYSMQGRYDVLEESYRKLGSDYNALKTDLSHARRELEEAQEEIADLTKRQLPLPLHNTIYGLAVDELATARQRMERAAEIMAELGDTPQDIAFGNAVKEYRSAKTLRAACETILKGLEALTE